MAGGAFVMFLQSVAESTASVPEEEGFITLLEPVAARSHGVVVMILFVKVHYLY